MTAQTRLDGVEVEFCFPDPDRTHPQVLVQQDLIRPRDGLPMTWRDGVWRLRLPRPWVHRMEYQFVLIDDAGARTFVPDPSVERRAETGWGPKSELWLPGYAPPAWLSQPAPSNQPEEWKLSPSLLGALPATVWAPKQLPSQQPAPLLVVHDGPDYWEHAQLGRLLEHLRLQGLPARTLLLSAPDRMDWYSANNRYADALSRQVLPAVRALYATTRTVLLGASLGGLAGLHLQWRAPGTVDALLLQSSSFFRPESDPQESSFEHYERITSFVLNASGPVKGMARLTCGSTEENVHNNRAMALALAQEGVDVRLTEHPDVHNYISWRDCLETPLRETLAG